LVAAAKRLFRVLQATVRHFLTGKLFAGKILWCREIWIIFTQLCQPGQLWLRRKLSIREGNFLYLRSDLQSLSSSVIRIIELDYKEARRKDTNGNWFRYRAKVRDVSGAQAGRWAWDVFLQKPD